MSDPHRSLKDSFGRFATGVTVVTCRSKDGTVSALTVNSFVSVSLEPPLVLWCVERRASLFSRFFEADNYAVSVLRADGQALSNRFAGRNPPPLEGREIEIWTTGAPLLKARLAGFDCRVVDRHDAGDHVILVGQVLRHDARAGAPLTYFASGYGVLPPIDG
ncbi:MAG: flavin reductase family protein [Pseudomonadota bacterium]